MFCINKVGKWVTGGFICITYFLKEYFFLKEYESKFGKIKEKSSIFFLVETLHCEFCRIKIKEFWNF